MTKQILVATVLVLASVAVHGQSQRHVGGIIYFTNNTPENIHSFPVQILSRNRKKIIATMTPDEHYQFDFAGVAPGKYVLKLTWPQHCVLWYRLDLRSHSRTGIQVIMDSECAHFNGKIRDWPAK